MPSTNRVQAERWLAKARETHALDAHQAYATIAIAYGILGIIDALQDLAPEKREIEIDRPKLASEGADEA